MIHWANPLHYHLFGVTRNHFETLLVKSFRKSRWSRFRVYQTADLRLAGCSWAWIIFILLNPGINGLLRSRTTRSEWVRDFVIFVCSGPVLVLVLVRGSLTQPNPYLGWPGPRSKHISKALFRILTAVLAVPLSVFWGLYFALLAFCSIWCISPCIKGFIIWVSLNRSGALVQTWDLKSVQKLISLF